MVVRRLAGSDAGFLFIESPTQSSTCVDLVIVEPPSDPAGALTVDALRRHIADRLHLVPSLRWRLHRVPLGIGHPVWIEDPDFDLDHHVRHQVLPAPGGTEELDALVARALPGRIDLRHPLWQVVLVDGLADGSQALVFRFHHTLADGAGLVSIIGRLLDEDGPPPAPTEAWRAGAPPRAAGLLLATLRTQLSAWAAVPRMVLDTIRRFRAVDARRAAAPVAVPRSIGDAPRCVLNDSADDRRVYARASLPLADLRTVRSTAGTSVSDVLLTVVAGGLRSYLADRGELPDQPLVANVPMGTDPPGAPRRQNGNVFSNYFSYLATDVDDPVKRLAAIADANAEAKRQLEILGHRTLPDWLDRIPPAVAAPAARRLGERRRTGRSEPDFNVLVSNMPADPSRWSIDGRRVTDFCMSGPAADGAGLNITATGAGDHVNLAVVANPAAVEHPAELAERLEAALAELVAAHAPVPA